MKINAAREVIHEHFQSEWSGSDDAYAFENEEFTPPDTAWVRLTVRHRDGGQETLGRTGNRRYLRRGVIVAQVFTPADRGTFASDAITTEILDMFESTRLDDDLWCRDGIIRGLPADGGMYRNFVEIEFDYEETK